MAAVPVPAFRLTLEGQDLTDRFAPRLLSLRLTEKRGGEADQLDIEVDDSDGRMQLPREGATLQLSLGWSKGEGVAAGLVDKGSFRVDEVEWGGAPDRLRITARSADLTAGFRQRRERSHRATTVGEIVGRVASANGLTAAVAPELASIAVPALAQDGVSDMALVRRLGQRYDAVATVRAGRLLFTPAGQGITVTGRPLPPFTITKASGDDYGYKRAERGRYQEVEARYYDQDEARRGSVRAPVGSEAGQSGGAAGSTRAIPDRASPDRGRGTRRLRRLHGSEAAARRAAEGERRRIRRGAAEFEIALALGRPDLAVERPGTVSGFKPEIDAQSWLIAELTHALDGSGGLTTTVKLETRA